MTTPEERDYIGEVIAEDAAERACQVAIGSMHRVGEAVQFQSIREFHVSDGMTVMTVTDHLSLTAEIRQQLADVSHERDLLRARKRLTQEQALIVSAYTGFMFVQEFSSLHGFIEKVLGRPVYTAEMGDGKIFEELRKALGSEFKDLVPDAAGAEVLS